MPLKIVICKKKKKKKNWQWKNGYFSTFFLDISRNCTMKPLFTTKKLYNKWKVQEKFLLKPLPIPDFTTKYGGY